MPSAIVWTACCSPSQSKCVVIYGASRVCVLKSSPPNDKSKASISRSCMAQGAFSVPTSVDNHKRGFKVIKPVVGCRFGDR